MNANINPEEFKELISGEISYNDFQNKRHIVHPIRVEYSENRITVKGDFQLSENIVFETGERYEKEIFFDGGTYKNIEFRGGYFKKIVFRRGTYDGFVSIRGGKIENLLLLGGTFNHWLGTLNGNDNIDNGGALADDRLEIERFEIEGGTYTNNIWISGGKIDSLEIKCITPVKIHCKPNDDKIFDTNKNEYTDRFNSSPDIRNLIISRYSNKDNFFHISKLKLDTIKFESFTNIGSITISDITLAHYVLLENSDLGKTAFIDCDFSKQKLYFDSSKITEVALVGTQLPTPENITGLSVDSQMRKVQKRLALSQIKKIYQSMGDMVVAARYQAEELDTYMSTLPLGWEKVNLWLNKKTNNHGQSWERALAVLFIGCIFWYTIYCVSLGICLEFSLNGINNFFRNSAYFLEFLNPIRKSDYLPRVLINAEHESAIPAFASVVDNLAKIFSAYLIYQLVAAFRKHGKKAE